MRDDEIVSAYQATLRGLSRQIVRQWAERDRREVARDIEQSGWEAIFKRRRAGKGFQWLAVVAAMKDEGCRNAFGVTRRAIKLTPRPRPVLLRDLEPRIQEFLS